MQEWATRSTCERIKKIILYQEGPECVFTVGAMDVLSDPTLIDRARRFVAAVKAKRESNKLIYGVTYCAETGGGQD